MSGVKRPIMLSLGAALGLVLTLVLGAAFTVLYQIEEHAITADQEDLTASFTRWLASSVEYHMERLNYYNVEQITRSLNAASFNSIPILSIQVFDRRAKLVNIGAPAFPSGGRTLVTERKLSASNDTYGSLGNLRIAWSLEPADLRLAMFRFNLVVILLIALGAGLAAIAFILNHTLNRPIHRLNLAAFKLSKHDWEVEFPVEREDEVGLLARTLDHIRGSLRSSFHETEALVEQRTAQLNESLKTQYTLNNQLIEQALEIKRRTEELVASERDAALGRLTASIAHELNTPIGNSVTGTSLLLKKMEHLTEKLEAGTMKRSDLDSYFAETGEILKSVEGNLLKAAELTTSFKAVAIDQTSEIPRAFNLGEYLGEIAVTLLPRLKKAGHTLTIDCPPEIVMVGYPGLLATIITNLAVNSVFHAWEPGTKDGHMAVNASEVNGQVEIIFRDDGMGIEPADLDNIFMPYFTTKAGKGGSGLGLHIVRSLIWKMKGSITVESVKYMGTTFKMKFPKEISSEQHG